VNAADAGTWAALAAAEELRCEPGLAEQETARPGPPAPAPAGKPRAASPAAGACAAAAARGLEAARRALALNPRLADAERLRGILELAAARGAAGPAARRQAAARARQALSRAVALDPLLRPRVAPLLDAAAAVAAGS
jgi:hypothetical protein